MDHHPDDSAPILLLLQETDTDALTIPAASVTALLRHTAGLWAADIADVDRPPREPDFYVAVLHRLADRIDTECIGVADPGPDR